MCVQCISNQCPHKGKKMTFVRTVPIRKMFFLKFKFVFLLLRLWLGLGVGAGVGLISYKTHHFVNEMSSQ